MRASDIFFWSACFFLVGVLIASIFSGFNNALVFSFGAVWIVVLALLFSGRQKLAVFGLVAILGIGYFFAFDILQKPAPPPYGEKVIFTGIVTEAEQRLESQKIIIRTYDGRRTTNDKIQITAPRYPKFEYGDELEISGTIKTTEGNWENYFNKENISGLMGFPEIRLLSKNNGSPVKASLLRVKAFFETSFQKVLSFDKAAFMSGLVLGETAGFSDEFKEKLRATGTSHLVALSGYNIGIIASTVASLLGLWWLTKKFTFIGSTLFIFAFVLMTGAEASVVRAAIMGFLMLLADQLQRVYYFRNAVAATALAMVLVNPKVLVFDIGFQLSFMALIGITYLEPWLREKFSAKKEAGFLGWRKSFWTTTSAQLAVLPILMYHFGFVSPVSILTNVLLLGVIPVTMGLGFFIGFASVVNYWLAWLIAIPAQALLGYELTIIDIFSRLLSIFH